MWKMSPHVGHEICEHIYAKWHEYAKNRQVDNLADLYAENAVLESPLIPAILNIPSGVAKGREEIRHFLAEGTKRRPNDLVLWYRTGKYFCDGTTLIWEYPRQIPEGVQIDILEVMELEEGKIQYHRIYWGWFGIQQLITSAIAKVSKETA